MKTVVLKPSELNLLSEEVRQQIFEVVENNILSIKELKERVKNLPSQLISFRDDINLITRTEKSDHLTIRIWQKTAGEQWGNNRGREYKFLFGRKYIVSEGSSFSSDSRDYDLGRVSVSPEKLDEFLKLIEEAFSCEDDPEDVDRDRLLCIACARIDSVFNPYN